MSDEQRAALPLVARAKCPFSSCAERRKQALIAMPLIR
jgi:hypothetical protein